MSKPVVNGVNGTSTYSVTFDHITSYPLISDLLSYYKSNPYGAKSLEVGTNIYNTLGKPVITHPLVQQPYSYVSPYAKKVDELGDNTLSHIDANFPVIKSTDLSTLKSHANAAVGYPFQVAGKSKDYVFSTYSDEYKKANGGSLLKTGTAVITTELRIISDTLQKVKEILGPKVKDAEGEADKLKGIGQEKATNAKKTAAAKKDELTK